jgi:hypothetical protein
MDVSRAGARDRGRVTFQVSAEIGQGPSEQFGQPRCIVVTTFIDGFPYDRRLSERCLLFELRLKVSASLPQLNYSKNTIRTPNGPAQSSALVRSRSRSSEVPTTARQVLLTDQATQVANDKSELVSVAFNRDTNRQILYRWNALPNELTGEVESNYKARSSRNLVSAGGGSRARTELSLQRILSPLSLILTTRNYWVFFFQHVKVCNFMCRF